MINFYDLLRLMAILASLFLASISTALFAADVTDENTASTPETNYIEGLRQRELSDDDYLGDVPQVLTISRLAQSAADAPAATTVIDRETIRASGIVDLPEIFRLVPGFYVGVNAGYRYNSNHVVNYHGLSTAFAGNMQVMINGRSVYSPLFGGLKWSELPLAIDDIERIEITRGPNAASYGANSYFGVINILTQQTTEAGNTIIAKHGNGRNEAFYRHGGKINNLNVRVTAGYREDDGLNNRNDFKRTRLLNAQADYRIDNNNLLEFEFGIANGARADGESAKDSVLFIPRERDIINHYELIRWQHTFSADSDFKLQAFHSFDSTEDDFTSSNIRANAKKVFITSGRSNGQATAIVSTFLNDQVAINNDIKQERFDLEAQHTFKLMPNLRGVWGANARLDTTYAPYWLGNQKTEHFNLQRLFGHVEWRLNDQWLVNVGSMLEHNSFTGTDISPRASINFKLTPKHTIRLGVSTALRTPNYVEEKFNASVLIPLTTPNTTGIAYSFLAKGNVSPEKIVSTELGYLGDFGRLSIDARLFHDAISDYIKTTRDSKFVAPAGFLLLSSPPINAANGGDVNINGLESQLKWRLSNKTKLLLNYAYINIKANEKDTAGNITKSSPKHTISTLISQQLSPVWDASLAYYQTSKVNALGDGDQVGLIRRTDIRLARKFKLNRFDGEVSAAVQNLFDNNYQEFANYNTLNRRGVIDLKLNF